MKRILRNPVSAKEIDAASDRAYGPLRGSSAPRTSSSIGTDAEIQAGLAKYHGTKLHVKRRVHDPETTYIPIVETAIADTSAPRASSSPSPAMPWRAPSRRSRTRSREPSAPVDTPPRSKPPVRKITPIVKKVDGARATAAARAKGAKKVSFAKPTAAVKKVAVKKKAEVRTTGPRTSKEEEAILSRGAKSSIEYGDKAEGDPERKVMGWNIDGVFHKSNLYPWTPASDEYWKHVKVAKGEIINIESDGSGNPLKYSYGGKSVKSDLPATPAATTATPTATTEEPTATVTRVGTTSTATPRSYEEEKAMLSKGVRQIYEYTGPDQKNVIGYELDGTFKRSAFYPSTRANDEFWEHTKLAKREGVKIHYGPGDVPASYSYGGRQFKSKLAPAPTPHHCQRVSQQHQQQPQRH